MSCNDTIAIITLTTAIASATVETPKLARDSRWTHDPRLGRVSPSLALTAHVMRSASVIAELGGAIPASAAAVVSFAIAATSFLSRRGCSLMQVARHKR